MGCVENQTNIASLITPRDIEKVPTMIPENFPVNDPKTKPDNRAISLMIVPMPTSLDFPCRIKIPCRNRLIAMEAVQGVISIIPILPGSTS